MIVILIFINLLFNDKNVNLCKDAYNNVKVRLLQN